MLGAEPTGRGLRLRAEDAEDLAVISACVQDALVAVRDLAYDPAARTFMLVANRFRWEESAGGTEAGKPFERTLCGITFDNIDSVAYRGFLRSEEDRILALLAIRPLPGGVSDTASAASPTTIDLEFAGEAKIRLLASAIRCRAHDFGEPWPTPWQPGHELDETG